MLWLGFLFNIPATFDDTYELFAPLSIRARVSTPFTFTRSVGNTPSPSLFAANATLFPGALGLSHIDV
jgi:hypothetical protein